MLKIFKKYFYAIDCYLLFDLYNYIRKNLAVTLNFNTGYYLNNLVHRVVGIEIKII